MSLQGRAIDKLKELGADKDQLWLVEVQTIEQAKKYYQDRIIEDLTRYSPEGHESIVYHHSNGMINSSATFKQGDAESFSEACEYIAEYLGG